MNVVTFSSADLTLQAMDRVIVRNGMVEKMGAGLMAMVNYNLGKTEWN